MAPWQYLIKSEMSVHHNPATPFLGVYTRDTCVLAEGGMFKGIHRISVKEILQTIDAALISASIYNGGRALREIKSNS